MSAKPEALRMGRNFSLTEIAETKLALKDKVRVAFDVFEYTDGTKDIIASTFQAIDDLTAYEDRLLGA
jgi:hypothetical protein